MILERHAKLWRCILKIIKILLRKVLVESHNSVFCKKKKMHIDISLVPCIGFPSYVTWKVHASLLMHRAKETSHLLDIRGWVGYDRKDSICRILT
jgi:hypothetical protein